MAAPEPPAGAVVAHTLYGALKDDTSSIYALGQVELSTSGAPYLGPDPAVDRAKKCKANDDTCNGWRLKNSDFCAGHAGILKPPGDR
jgi:hypothetical protein